MPNENPKSDANTNKFFQVRANSVPSEIPLPYDVFLLINGKFVLFRKSGDIITDERLNQLLAHKGANFWIPEEERAIYQNALKNIIHNPDTPTEVKAKFLKESAFNVVDDLFNSPDLSHAVGEAKSHVEDMVSLITSDITSAATLMRLSSHHDYTYNHCVNVSVYTIVLAKRAGINDKKKLIIAGLGGLLHDLGKKDIPITILNKEGKLTTDEWAEIKRHPSYGKDALESNPEISKDTRMIVFEHHENMNGTGYPRGLQGDEISKLSRVVTIADVFDALTTDRSYQKKVPPKDALDIMFGMQPGKFDPDLFKLFTNNFEKRSLTQLPEDFDPCMDPSKRKP